MAEQQNSGSLPSTAEEIFRNAIAQNAMIHARSLEDIQRHTDEVHAQLRSATQSALRRMQLPEFSFVHRAMQLEEDFWSDTVARAKDVLREHDELPAEDETDQPEPEDGQETGA